MRARMPVTFSPADLTSADAARKIVEDTLDLVRRGKMPTSVANVVQKLVAVGLKANETKLAERIAALEERLR
jgi:hypothetical protein